jgi:hypothetical protein
MDNSLIGQELTQLANELEMTVKMISKSGDAPTIKLESPCLERIEPYVFFLFYKIDGIIFVQKCDKETLHWELTTNQYVIMLVARQ